MASRSVNCDWGSGGYFPRFVNSEGCSAASLCYGTEYNLTANGNSGDFHAYVRPVVILKLGVHLIESTRTGYDWDVDQT